MTKGKSQRKSKKKSKGITPVIQFPMKLIQPIGAFLSREAKRLEGRKKRLSQQDPFSDTSRINDNAASDMDAREQSGHARVAAMQKHVDRKLIQIKKALTMIKLGKYGTCEKCGQMIDTDRLTIMPEATICIKCEKKKEK